MQISDYQKNRAKSRFIFRIVIPGIIFLIYIMITKLAYGFTPFFAHLTHSAIDVNDMTIADMYNGRTVKGEIVDIVDCLASSVTTETNKSGKITSKYTDSYYWVAILDTNTLMIVHAPDSVHGTMDYNAELFWKSLEPETDSDDMSMYSSGSSGYYDKDGNMVETHRDGEPYIISVDATLTKNDKEVVALYEKWLRDTGLNEADFEVTLAPYTLDMTKSYSSSVKAFGIGMLLLAVAITATWMFVVTLIKDKKKKEQRAAASVNAASGSYDTYGDTYRSQNSTASQPFQSQNNNNFQSQQISAYGSLDSTYQSQNNRGYGNTKVTYQSQRSAYNSNPGNTYQSQNSGGYGNTGVTYQLQQSGGYGYSGSTYQSQSSTGYSNQNSMYQSQNSTGNGNTDSSYPSKGSTNYSRSGYTNYGFSDDLYNGQEYFDNK